MRFGAKDFGRRLALYLCLSVGLTLLFAVTYGTTNWLASRRSDLYHLSTGNSGFRLSPG